MFVAALVVPGVFDDEGVLFGAAFLVVCAMHIALYALAGRGNRDLLSAVLRLAPWPLRGATLILVAGFADGARTWLWVAASRVHVRRRGSLSGSTGWRVHSSHFAERYGLVVIIALGEAFVSIGIGATRDRHRAGRDRGSDPRAAGRHLVLARVLRLLLDPRRADAHRPARPGSRCARPRPVRVRAPPDDRRHRALRVRDEDRRSGTSATNSTPSQPSRSAAGARSICSRTRRSGSGSNGG